MMNKFHPFHMITMSPWPITASLIACMSMYQTTLSFSGGKKAPMMQMTMATLMVMATLWWNDTMKEASKEGFHQSTVIKGLKMGMLLFITSEVMFFSSFFWAYFHNSISPSMEIGQAWPPTMVTSFNPVNVPLLNTLVLISSGVSVTWSHHSILKNNKKSAIKSMMVTCTLGAYFSALQYMEYSQAEFSINDSNYGSVFFMATGFHGIHVLVGSMFLMVSALSMMKMVPSKWHHTSFEMAAWYWHFVDVVWLFLYLSIYWWGE